MRVRLGRRRTIVWGAGLAVAACFWGALWHGLDLVEEAHRNAALLLGYLAWVVGGEPCLWGTLMGVARRAGLLVEGREVEARLALAQLYRPEAGDTVLALGGREYYVVGVLAGAGRMVVNAPGDLELRARGAVEIHGARGVRLRGPEVALAADRFTIAVRTVVERAARVYRAATELLHVRARRTRTVVDEECALAAREITARAGADLKLDGEKIHLG